MEQSLQKVISNDSDRYPQSYQKESSNNTCDPNIHPTPSSPLFVIQDTQNNFICNNPSILTHWSDSYLDKCIKILFQEKLVRRLAKGYPFESLKHHQNKLMNELMMTQCEQQYSTNSFRESLINLLITTSKQNFKQIPADQSEWLKLLNLWIKANSTCNKGIVISNRDIYRILAVDGFQGFEPKHLKLYLPGVLFPIRMQYESHYRGVREMYEYFDKNVKLSSLTGTDSACIVFLTLLQWSDEDLMVDDQIKFKVRQAKSWAEGYLQQHAEYYQDIKNVDESIFKELGDIYASHQVNSDAVGRELLKDLVR